MQNKLKVRWKHFHRIIAKRGPTSYLIQNQLDGSISKAHAIDLNPVNLDEWDIPCTKDGRPMRIAAYVIPPDESTSEEDDSEPEEPMKKIVKRYRKERGDSDEEDDIPLMELSKRLKALKAEEEEIRQAEEQRQYLGQEQPVDDSIDDSMGEEAFDVVMSVNVVTVPKDTESIKVNCPQLTDSKAEESDSNLKVKKAEALLMAHQTFIHAMSGLS